MLVGLTSMKFLPCMLRTLGRNGVPSVFCRLEIKSLLYAVFSSWFAFPYKPGIYVIQKLFWSSDKALTLMYKSFAYLRSSGSSVLPM